MGVGRVIRQEGGVYKCDEGHIYAIDPMGKKTPAELEQAKLHHYETTKHDNDLRDEYMMLVEPENDSDRDVGPTHWPSDVDQVGVYRTVGKQMGSTA